MGKTRLTNAARAASLSIAIAAFVAQAIQTQVDLNEGRTLLAALWHQVLYFTNIMTWMVVLLFGWQTITARSLAAGLLAAVALWDAFVGIVYHALLAATHHPKGMDIFVNHLHHTAVPIMVFAYWMFLAPKKGLDRAKPFIWLIFPNAYAIYALLRGLAGGSYPYFFLNPTNIGWLGVALYLVALNLAFLIAGLLMYAAVRGRAKAG